LYVGNLPDIVKIRESSSLGGAAEAMFAFSCIINLCGAAVSILIHRKTMINSWIRLTIPFFCFLCSLVGTVLLEVIREKYFPIYSLTQGFYFAISSTLLGVSSSILAYRIMVVERHFSSISTTTATVITSQLYVSSPPVIHHQETVVQKGTPGMVQDVAYKNAAVSYVNEPVQVNVEAQNVVFSTPTPTSTATTTTTTTTTTSNTHTTETSSLSPEDDISPDELSDIAARATAAYTRGELPPGWDYEVDRNNVLWFISPSNVRTLEDPRDDWESYWRAFRRT
jgi:hypothetical protein